MKSYSFYLNSIFYLNAIHFLCSYVIFFNGCPRLARFPKPGRLLFFLQPLVSISDLGFAMWFWNTMLIHAYKHHFVNSEN